jgi:predicted ester cyclase
MSDDAALDRTAIEEVERRLIDEMWTDGDLALVDEYHAEDLEAHWMPEGAEDRDGVRSFVAAIHEGFDRFTMEEEFLVVGDGMATVGFTASGRHTGRFMGVPATRKIGEVTGMYAHRFEDAVIAESWSSWDALGMFQQLGVLPEDVGLSSFLGTGFRLAKHSLFDR